MDKDSTLHLEGREIGDSEHTLEIKVEQIMVESLDIMAVVIRLPERLIFIVSVYVEGGNILALDNCDYKGIMGYRVEIRYYWEDKEKWIQSLTL
ncbi:hypothetical protein N7493_000960 [Penicillium malachiteum]|uniref:Uncharacterized protein n=1 Tax=Penicillium malachiteum TaxID=1324776 RepID=A0AAD6N193_9EURO|nr:hypothetical protein N7493_000960 [Penicillium malachiteum]